MNQFVTAIVFMLTTSVNLFANQHFVELNKVDSSIKQEMMYFQANNFVGEKIDGYKQPTCILTKQAALALKEVQTELASVGMGLLVFDCYRPQTAVDHFVRFSKSKDQSTKSLFYPNLDKDRMFREGYVATKSGHSRGSTVDLTIISLTEKRGGYYLGCKNQANKKIDIDFGTGVDCMDPKSNTLHENVSSQVKLNRLFFVHVMEKHGFKNLPEEWWHFTLANEPFPNTYFDFPVDTLP